MYKFKHVWSLPNFHIYKTVTREKTVGINCFTIGNTRGDLLNYFHECNHRHVPHLVGLSSPHSDRKTEFFHVTTELVSRRFLSRPGVGGNHQPSRTEPIDVTNNRDNLTSADVLAVMFLKVPSGRRTKSVRLVYTVVACTKTRLSCKHGAHYLHTRIVNDWYRT